MTVRASVLLVAAFALAILVQTPLAVSQTNLGSVTGITGPQTCPASFGSISRSKLVWR